MVTFMIRPMSFYVGDLELFEGFGDWGRDLP